MAMTEERIMGDAKASAEKAREVRRIWAKNRDKEGREIGPPPPPLDPDRRERAAIDLGFFLRTYFPKAFSIEWAEFHTEVIQKTERAVSQGLFFAEALPRGSGKTTMATRSIIWAILNGYSRFVYLICADAKKAQNALEAVKIEFEFNDLLFEDYPDLLFPIRALERSPLRAKGQTVNGESTLISWTADTVKMPSVEGAIGSGAVIGVGGITGAARGAQRTMPDGEVIRPSLVLVDDPQTRESAASPTQCAARIQTMVGDLAGMVGPGEQMSILATMTVVYQDDVADQLLNRELHPEWHGVRKKLVNEWPQGEEAKVLWDRYLEMRARAMRLDEPLAKVNRFYESNRETMDFGHHVSWPQRKRSDEISAIQHAYNLQQTVGDEAFASEYQNDPLTLQDIEDFNFLSAGEIAKKKAHLRKGIVPSETVHVVSAIDVQQNSLWYVTTAWDEKFNGVVVDYGTYPKQKQLRFTRKGLRETFQTMYPNHSLEEAIYRSIRELGEQLARTKWVSTSGTEMYASRVFVDEGFKTDTVYLAVRDSDVASILMPCRGIGITASMLPMDEWQTKKGDYRPGLNNRVQIPAVHRKLRALRFDTNFWKTFLQERLATLPGGKGCLQLYGGGSGNPPVDHAMLSEHLTAETPIMTEGRGRKVIEWKLPPNHPDNDWLDATVMTTVGASMLGVSMDEAPKPARKRRYKTLAEKRAERRQ